MTYNTPTEKCPECNAHVDGGRAGCQWLLEVLSYQMMSDVRIANVYRLAFDTYCMQHVETYCVSAKSYAAHLVGLAVGVEQGGDPASYDLIHRWLNGSVALTKPAVLADRGSLTIADIIAADDVDARVTAIRDWSLDVWAAYTSQHSIARAWLDAMRARRT